MAKKRAAKSVRSSIEEVKGNIMNRFSAGLLSGFVATAPMSVVMQILHRWPHPERESLPPHQITKQITARIGVKKHLDKPQLKALTLVNHFGFGAVGGAIYAILAPKIPLSPLIKGIIWGAIVWSLSYLGWLPATNILQPATEHSRQRNFLMILAHFVWGISTALLTEKLTQKESS